MTMIQIPDYCEITVRRANGQIETINYTQAMAQRGQVIKTLCGSLLVAIRNAYKAAGCEVLSVRHVSKTIEALKPTAAEIESDRAHADYVAHHNRVAGMSAGGESHDTIR